MNKHARLAAALLLFAITVALHAQTPTFRNYRDPFDRIVRESSTYYSLAYTSTNSKVDGKYRRTQINVKRSGVQTFYRAGYVARRP